MDTVAQFIGYFFVVSISIFSLALVAIMLGSLTLRVLTWGFGNPVVVRLADRPALLWSWGPFILLRRWANDEEVKRYE